MVERVHGESPDARAVLQRFLVSLPVGHAHMIVGVRIEQQARRAVRDVRNLDMQLRGAVLRQRGFNQPLHLERNRQRTAHARAPLLHRGRRLAARIDRHPVDRPAGALDLRQPESGRKRRLVGVARQQDGREIGRLGVDVQPEQRLVACARQHEGFVVDEMVAVGAHLAPPHHQRLHARHQGARVHVGVHRLKLVGGDLAGGQEQRLHRPREHLAGLQPVEDRRMGAVGQVLERQAPLGVLLVFLDRYRPQREGHAQRQGQQAPYPSGHAQRRDAYGVRFLRRGLESVRILRRIQRQAPP